MTDHQGTATTARRPEQPIWPWTLAAPLALLIGLTACSDDNPSDAPPDATSSTCVEGAGCNDGEACTMDDTCIDNECIGTLLDCTDNNPCTDDGCDAMARTCLYAAIKEGEPCDDGDACTAQTGCLAGKCTGESKDCADGELCTWDGCDPKTGECLHQQGDKACDDGSVCTADSCDPVKGCSHTTAAQGAPCPGGVCDQGTCKAGPEGMELVPAGTFWMGCNDAVEADDCLPEERPQHEVKLSAYWIHRNHVSVADYKKCVAAGACTAPDATNLDMKHYNWGLPGREKHPINGVTWFQSKAYCTWIGARLPTEAEWEMAARGSCAHNPGPDCRKAMRKYPWGNAPPTCELAVLDPSKRGAAKGCGHDTTWEIGLKPAGASPYGLLDMAGNAWDWVDDCMVPESYLKGKGKVLQDPSENACDDETFRVFRGGSFYSFPAHVRTSRRDFYYPQFEYDCVSFRCASPYTKP